MARFLREVAALRHIKIVKFFHTHSLSLPLLSLSLPSLSLSLHLLSPPSLSLIHFSESLSHSLLSLSLSRPEPLLGGLESLQIICEVAGLVGLPAQPLLQAVQGLPVLTRLFF